MNHLDALDLAIDEFGRRVELVADHQWDGPTPCPGWDVRFLVAHVVGGNRFASLVLDGESSERAIERIMTTPQLGTSPAADATTSAAEQRHRFRHLDRLNRLDHPVEHPAGSIPARRFLSFRIFDITLHAWDLAAAIGADPALDPGLVDVVHEVVAAEQGGLGFGIEPLGRVGPDASPQERLLDLTGRPTPP